MGIEEETALYHLGKAQEDRAWQRWAESTKCIDCPKCRSKLMPVGDGGSLLVAYCRLDDEFLTPDEYRSTIDEMGCAPWGC